MNSRERSGRGITLIEVMVVVAIVAIVGLLMLPSLGDWLANFRLRQGAREIASTLQWAKMQAISSRQQYTVTFNIEDGAYQVNPGGVVKKVHKKVVIVSVAPADPFTFRPDGSCANSGVITIRNDRGDEYDVAVSATGRVQVNKK